jgi:hypothetical protein
MEVIKLKMTSISYFNPVVSTIPTWLTFKFLRWVHILNRLVELDEILYSGDDIEGDSLKMADV